MKVLYILSITFQYYAASNLCASSGFFLRVTKFLSLIDFDPDRAGINAQISLFIII